MTEAEFNEWFFALIFDVWFWWALLIFVFGLPVVFYLFEEGRKKRGQG